MIEHYMTALRRAVPGPAPGRAGMLREIRDGLDDAAAAHEADGADRRDAQRRAVAEFGPPGVVASAVRVELAASLGRSIAAFLVVVGTLGWASSQLTWQAAADRVGWPAPAPGYKALATTVDVFNLVVVLALVASVFLLGRGGRAIDTRRMVRTFAVGVFVVIAVEIAGGAALFIFTPLDDLHRADPWQLATLLAPYAAVAVAGWLAWRCLRLTSGGGAGAEDGSDDPADLEPVVSPFG